MKTNKLRYNDIFKVSRELCLNDNGRHTIK